MLEDIERIEVISGPGTTLWGANAVNGVINIITKKVGIRSFGGNSLLSYGSNNTFRGNAAVNGKTGIVNYDIAYSFFDTKGINEAISSFPNADRDGYQQNNLQTGVGIHPAKNIFLLYNHLSGISR